ncbi:MAG: Rnase Y domain-containing protein, partial [Syntrophales bacterium]|nr:Rnase Y domain-containing protein [Syntrophales bacterium]
MLLITFGTLIAGIALGYGLSRMLVKKRLQSSESFAERIVAEAKKDAETIKKESVLQAKETLLKTKAEFEKDTRDRKIELDNREKRIRSKEESLDKRIDSLSQKEANIENRDKSLLQKEAQLNENHAKLDRIMEEQRQKMEKIAGMTSEEAKNCLIQSMEEDAKREAAIVLRKIEEETRRTADNKSREIIAYAVQRYSGDFVAENTVSVVTLPNDEMKGRIIGREGRNIRAIEAATGIDLIVDDTPEAVVLSSFDPIRREVARLSLERLITDGRIHPGRIEDIVKKVRVEVDTI